MKRFNKTAIAIALSGALALGAAPAADAQENLGAPAATINHEGATWYLHSNGQFYVNDAGLVYTPVDQIEEEKKIALEADNAEGEQGAPAGDEQYVPAGDEVVEVGGNDAADSERGVNAETGNNTIAKGLVGLLLASIMGAAIFAFGRRHLV
ncbi:hypothetical protein M3A74_04505 [Corynebacterium appendicis]|uniref:hypothetical protein n=1 Tax=Corynebacterium appendicis TaxID=163202 RepID=UPI00223AF8F2|nr:hypothetical protein [Corynebacterium appendicis]MCT1684078.1 hypothetical protein [Corynebacterium appendicis]